MPLRIVEQDITRIRVDAIVNAANPLLSAGGGVCGAIFTAAGAEKMRKACDKIGSCPVGGAVITRGFSLPARWVIHTVGPVWQGGAQGEEAQLRACYQNALSLASARHLRSIAFPLISAGIYGYPRDAALAVAISEIGNYLIHHDLDVTLALFERDAALQGAARFRGIRAMLGAKAEAAGLAAFAARKQAYVSSADLASAMPMPCAAPAPAPAQKTSLAQTKLAEAAERAGETFSQRLLRFIDERGYSDPEVYRRANLDRRLFSKIRANKHYQPSKSTVLALAVALRLNLDQTADLLRAAGYALSPGSRFDRIVEYFIENETYDIFEINEALYAFGESLLGV
jgi:O-acetyl-ADP-ribose deacetylase (regulator of RNase III)